MSDFKAKRHQNRFRLGLCPRPRWGNLQRSPDPWLDLRGSSSKEREGKGRKKGKAGRRDGMEKGRNDLLTTLVTWK